METIENVSGDYTMISDGMAYVLQSQVTHKTFGQLSIDLLSKVLTAGVRASRIDVVFDVYRDLSIKNVERNRRSKGQLLFKKIVASSEITQWGSFLSCNENKNSLVEFIVSQWQKPKYRVKIGQKPFYVTNRADVFKINETETSKELELQNNHEEADTRILFHAKHASANYSKILISSPGTDVFFICLSIHMTITANLFFLTGVKNSRRITTVTKVAEYIFNTLKGCDVSKETLMKSLIRFHSFTGCDTTSLFAGRVKVKPLKLMLNDARYVQAFAQLGQHTEINYVELQTIRSFVYHIMAARGIIRLMNCATECTVRVLVKLLLIIYHHAVMLYIYII